MVYNRNKPPRRAATRNRQQSLILVYVTNVTTSEHTKHLKGIFQDYHFAGHLTSQTISTPLNYITHMSETFLVPLHGVDSEQSKSPIKCDIKGVSGLSLKAQYVYGPKVTTLICQTTLL